MRTNPGTRMTAHHTLYTTTSETWKHVQIIHAMYISTVETFTDDADP